MKILKIRDVKTPTRGTKFSAGYDFYIPNDMPWEKYELQPNESINIPSGIKVILPKNYTLIAFNKSGVALKQNLDHLAEVVDYDYNGEIYINIINVGNKPSVIERGQKIIQFLLIPVLLNNEIEEIDNEYFEKNKITTERGEGGFGSTGKY